MQQQSLVSLRLVCDGSRAEAGSSLERNKTLRSACLQDGKHEASYEGRNAHRVDYKQEDAARDKFMIRIDLMWRDICKATACVDVPSIPVAISAAPSKHYATAQSFGYTNNAPLRLSDEAAVPRLGPFPHSAYGRLLCGHRVNAKVSDCDICKLLDTWSFVR